MQYTQFVDWHARNRRKTPDFELQNFFGQLHRSLLLELPSAPRLNLDEPTTVILVLIWEVKATLKGGIYYYKEFGIEEVVDMKTVQCAIGRVQDRAEWAIVNRSDIVVWIPESLRPLYRLSEADSTKNSVRKVLKHSCTFVQTALCYLECSSREWGPISCPSLLSWVFFVILARQNNRVTI